MNPIISKENLPLKKPFYLDWTASKWRDLLLEHYFTSNIENHGVTYLFITESTLAQLAGETSDQADNVYRAFRTHLPTTLNELENIFDSYDKYESSTSLLSLPNINLIRCNPHHLLLLMFSCLVACTDPDPTAQKSQYPQRMQRLLGLSKTPQKISGLAGMWRAFKYYLDDRNKNNLCFRPLCLPNPGNETRIGYPKRLAFPEIRDRQKVREKFVNLTLEIVTPDWVAHQFTNVEVSKYSESFKNAHGEFQSVLLQGGHGSKVETTKFYEAIKEIVLEENFDRETKETILLDVDLFYDLKDPPYIEITPVAEEHERLFQENERLNSQWIDKFCKGKSYNIDPELFRALKNGMLFFSQYSFAQWRWTPILENDQDLKVLLNQARCHVNPIYKVKSFSLFDNWVLLSIDRKDVQDFLNTIPSFLKEMKTSVQLIGAARVGLGYLLNSVSQIEVKVPGANEVAYRVEGQEWLSLILGDDDVWGSINSGIGSVLVRVSSKNALIRHRKFQTHNIALRHPKLKASKKSNYFIHLLNPQNAAFIHLDIPVIGKSENKLDDLLEVIYAQGRNGLTEQEIIGWIRLAYPQRSVSPWYVLQGFVDAGWLEESYLLHWPARTFFLRPLTCIRQSIEEDKCRLHFDGALPQILRRRIKEVLIDEGLEISEGNSVSTFAPLPLFSDVCGKKVRSIVNSLDADLIEMQLFLAPEKKIEHKATMAVHRTWCWSKRSFVEPLKVMKDISNGVRLDKLRFKAQHGMDRYQISFEGKTTQYYFPQVAIRSAYLKAREPLFKLDSEKLISLTQYATISSELARFWRFQTLTSSGLVENKAGGFSYEYSCPDERLLSQCPSLKSLIAMDIPIIPFWMQAKTFQSIAHAEPVLFCNETGLISPKIKIISEGK